VLSLKLVEVIIIDDRSDCSSPRLIDDVSRGLATLFFWGEKTRLFFVFFITQSFRSFCRPLSHPVLQIDARPKACCGSPVRIGEPSVISMTNTPNVTS
jgi:hypothetical protein